MENRGSASRSRASGSTRRAVATVPSLNVWTFSLLALLMLASGDDDGSGRRSIGPRGGGVWGVGGSIRRRIGGGGRVRGKAIFPSRSVAASRSDLAILLDCDAQTLPTMLNFLLGMSEYFDIAELVDMTHVVCLDDESCRAVSEIGLKIASSGIANTVRDGFNAMAKKIEPEKFMLPGNVSYRGNWLDDVMLAREYALLDLLNQEKMVLRSDADTCFRENPFAFMNTAQSDIAVTVQPLDPAHENGFWAYDWSCPDSRESKLELTLNNGVILVDGRKKAARDTYGLAVGSSIKLLYRQLNGWGQRGFNAVLHDEKLCLKVVEAAKRTMRGVTSRGLRVASMNVCSPCEGCSDASSSVVAHANCEQPASAKSAWLKHVKCWFMPSDWERIRSTGDAVDHLHLLKVNGMKER